MRVIIAGGGFAGMNLAKALAGKKDLEVILVDRNNYHFFPPLLYQVATSFIEPSNISYPFRRMFQDKTNVHFYNGVLMRILPGEKKIETDNGLLSYDCLVLAMGTKVNFFGMENVQQYARPMKTIDDAIRLRNHLLLNLEKAARTGDEKEREKLTTVVIAGGGPTGVEVAGMLAEMDRKVIRKDYPELINVKRRIYLVNSGPILLKPMSSRSQQEAKETLEELGVEIKLEAAVRDYSDDRVILSNGEEIAAATLVWATGVTAGNVPGLPAESNGRGHRIIVDTCNRVKGADHIFAIGDVCIVCGDPQYPEGHPQLAQVAIQQAKRLATNLQNLAAGKDLVPFHYRNKGSMAIIAKYKAVVDLPGGFYKGFFAWLTWLFIHIIPLAGFRNKAKLAYNWFWSFITNDPTLRLIIRPRKE